MERNRVFNIQGNYIEHQEITVSEGGVLNFGAPVKAVSPEQEDCGAADHEGALHTPEADRLWKIAQERGWVDDRLEPTLSKTQAAVLASVMADMLDLHPRWVPFEQLWGIHDLAQKLSRAQYFKNYSDLMHTFEEAFL